jgi:hypothetical protein
MTHAIRIHEVGGPEVLRWEEVMVAEPGPAEARIRQTAAVLILAFCWDGGVFLGLGGVWAHEEDRRGQGGRGGGFAKARVWTRSSQDEKIR